MQTNQNLQPNLALAATMAPYVWVKNIYTLGPSGTNCERAAQSWAKQRCPNASVQLQSTMEQAASCVTEHQCSVLLSVVAYPQLHTIMYSHLQELRLVDLFIMNTDEMVLASKDGSPPRVCSTHPSPEKLLPEAIKREFVSSNSCAAAACANGHTDCCITTACAADHYKLRLLKNYGQVPMGFTIHAHHETPSEHQTPQFL